MSNLVNDDEPMIPSKKKRDDENTEKEKEDRLSDLPECVLLHILSFLNTNLKHVVQTCILSTRWKHLWKRALPALILHYSPPPRNYFSFDDLDFSFRRKSFDELVSRILQLRDDSIVLHTFHFERHHSTEPSYNIKNGAPIEPRILTQIAFYILSYTNHLHQLSISLKGDASLILSCVSACWALTSLKLSLYPYCFPSQKILFPKSLNLPALTTLDLTNFAFCPDENNADHFEPFASFNRLHSLIICNCTLKDAKYRNEKILSISSETLVTLSMVRNFPPDFNKIELSTPSLCTLTFIGGANQKLCGSSFSSVKQLNMNINSHAPTLEAPCVPISWLLNLPNITSLTVTATTLLIISLVPDLLKLEFPSLCNLKSLKVMMEQYSHLEKRLLWEAVKSWKEANIERPFEAGLDLDATRLRMIGTIVGFFCQNSPSAQVDFIDDL